MKNRIKGTLHPGAHTRHQISNLNCIKSNVISIRSPVGDKERMVNGSVSALCSPKVPCQGRQVSANGGLKWVFTVLAMVS